MVRRTVSGDRPVILAASATLIHVASLIGQQYHGPLTPVNYHAKRIALSPFSGMGGMDLLHCLGSLGIWGMACRYPGNRTLWAESSIVSITGHVTGRSRHAR